jgi:SagB-type dehydrogenase family enzyme
MLPADDATSLALLYHLNSRPWLDGYPLPDQSYEVPYGEIADLDNLVALPQSDGESILANLLLKRRSCRSYLARPLQAGKLSTLLQNSYAITQNRKHPTGFRVLSRPVPSAGGVYPLEVYIVTQQVVGVRDGLYHYSILDHGLEPIRGGVLLGELADILLGQYFLVNANAIIIFSAVFGRTLRKYGARGYRYILLEAGHAAHSLCLAAAEQGLGSLCIGDFSDSELNRFLGLDGVTNAAIYSVAVGYTAERTT